MKSLFDTIDLRFADWIEKHQHIYRIFVEIALKLKREGHRHWSADAIYHVVRWERRAHAIKEGGYRLNDHFPSRLARKAMAEYPELDGFFATRKLRS